MKPASLILLILCILCILCISITQDIQAIDIVIPDGKGGKYFCDSEKGYSAVESEKSRLQSEGYEIHITIEETNCWITYIIQSSKDGKTFSSRYNLSKMAPGCGEIYAKAGCGTTTKRDVENMCTEAEASSAAGSHLAECVSKEAAFCKDYNAKYGGGCAAGKCTVEALEGSGCSSEYSVIAKGRWTIGGGEWAPVVYYAAITPVCNEGCAASTPMNFGCNYQCEEEDTTPEGGDTGGSTGGESAGGNTQPGGGKKCTEAEAMNAAAGPGTGASQSTGDGRCWMYAIGTRGTYLYPYEHELKNPQSDCCMSYGMAGCVSYCETEEGEAYYRFDSGGEKPEENKEECSVCDYMKKMEENKLDPEKLAQEIAKQFFDPKNTEVGEDGTSNWSRIGDQIINETMRQEIADEIDDELFDTESLETLRDTALNPNESTQSNINVLREELNKGTFQSDDDFTRETVERVFLENVKINDSEKEAMEKGLQASLEGVFDDVNAYISASPVFSMLTTKTMRASGNCIYEITVYLGSIGGTHTLKMDFCQYQKYLEQMSIVFRFIASIISVIIILR